MTTTSMSGVLARYWFALLLAHAFLFQSLIMMLRVSAIYQAVSIGLDGFWIGVIGGAFGLLPAILGLHLGRFIDRMGEPAALIAGSAAVLSASLGFWFVDHSLASLIAMSTLLGFGQFLGVAGQHSAVGAMDSQARDTNFGRLTMAISIAHAIGPLVIGFFAGDALIPDMQAIFVVGTVASVLLVLIACLIRMPGHASQSSSRSILETAGILLATKGFVLSTFSSLVIYSAMDLLVIYLPLYGAERGIGAATIGALLAARGAASVITRLFYSSLMRFMGRGKLLVTALVMAGLSIAALTIIDVPIFMGALLFITGLGLGIGAPLTLAWVSEISPAGMRGSGLSLRLAINRVGEATLPVAAGTAISGIGSTAVLLTMSATLLSMSAVSARYFGMFRG